MIGGRSSGIHAGDCRRFRPGLLRALEDRSSAHDAVDGGSALGDFVAFTERFAGTEAAGHLERCAACRAETTEIALTLNRIDRWARDAATVEPPSDGWGRLRNRLEASRRRAQEAAWRARATMAGLVTSTLIVGVLAAPMTLTGTGGGWALPGTSAAWSGVDQFIGEIEWRYVQQVRIAPIDDGPGDTIPTPAVRMLPDGIQPATKEVTPTQPAVRARDVS